MWRTAKAQQCSLLHWVECDQQQTATASSPLTADWHALHVSSERRPKGKRQWAGLRTCWSLLRRSHFRSKSLYLEAFCDAEKQLENNHVALLWVSILKKISWCCEWKWIAFYFWFNWRSALTKHTRCCLCRPGLVLRCSLFPKRRLCMSLH